MSDMKTKQNTDPYMMQQFKRFRQDTCKINVQYKINDMCLQSQQINC